MKLFHKLLISVLAAVLIIFAAIGYISYTKNSEILESEIENSALILLNTNIANLSKRLSDLQNLAVTVGVGYEAFGPANEGELKTLITNALEKVPYAYGSTIALQPTFDGNGGELFAPYYFRSNDKIKYVNLGTPKYNYPEKDWYKTAFVSGKAQWSKPYIDVGGGDTAMVTYSYPVRQENAVKAVATADVSLRELTELVDDIKVGTTGRAFLIGKDGMILAMPENKWVFKRTVFDAAKELGNPRLDKVGKDMMAGKQGFEQMTDPLTKKPGWIMYGPVPLTGWSMAILVPEEELIAGLKELHTRILITAIIGLILLIVVIYFINRTVTKPLTRLTDSAKRISTGEYDIELSGITAKGEIGDLTRAFAEMKDSLLQSIDSLYQAQNIGGAAIEALPDAILIMDTDWKIKHNNAAAQSFFKLPVDGSFLDYITTAFESSLDRTQIGTVSRESANFTLKQKEGDQTTGPTIACSVTPIYNKSGTVTHYVMSARSANS